MRGGIVRGSEGKEETKKRKQRSVDRRRRRRRQGEGWKSEVRGERVRGNEGKRG